MIYLLDTHIVLWLANSPDKLSGTIKSILQDSDSKIYFSAINLWEVVIKNQLNRQSFNVDTAKLYQQLLSHDFIELPVLAKHTLTLESLPKHHKDPFDRLLIAQAIDKDMTLITHDVSMWRYKDIKILKA